METSNMHIGKDTTRYKIRNYMLATVGNGDLLITRIVYIEGHQNCSH